MEIWTLFPRSSFLHACVLVSPVKYRPLDSPGDDCWSVSVFRAKLGSTVETCALVYSAYGEIPGFLRQGGTQILGRFSSLFGLWALPGGREEEGG